MRNSGIGVYPRHIGGHCSTGPCSAIGGQLAFRGCLPTLDGGPSPIVSPASVNIVAAVEQGWQGRLEVFDPAGHAGSAEALFGAALNWSDGLDEHDIPKPPDPPNSIPTITLTRDFNDDAAIGPDERLLLDIVETGDTLWWHFEVFVPDGVTVEVGAHDGFWDAFTFHNTAFIQVHEPQFEQLDLLNPDAGPWPPMLSDDESTTGGTRFWALLVMAKAHFAELYPGWTLFSTPGPAPQASVNALTFGEAEVPTIYGWNADPLVQNWELLAPGAAEDPASDISLIPVTHGYFLYREPGYYTSRNEAIYWDGQNETGERVASGVYFYELRAGDFRDIRHMAIVK